MTKLIASIIPKVMVSITNNNILVSVITDNGNVFISSSSGILGYKGSKKSGIFSASAVGSNIVNKLLSRNINKVNVTFKGRGLGKEAFLAEFYKKNIMILQLEDKKVISFNGCRPSKRRRI
jgi:small subunit ribosomal protein S11